MAGHEVGLAVSLDAKASQLSQFVLMARWKVRSDFPRGSSIGRSSCWAKEIQKNLEVELKDFLNEVGETTIVEPDSKVSW